MSLICEKYILKMCWSKELNVCWVGVDTMIAISFEVDICS